MVPCFWQIQRTPPPPTLAGQLGEPTAALCRAELPPVAPPVATWTKEEKLAGVFSGHLQTQERPQAGLPCSHSNLWTLTVVPLRGLASGTTGIIVWSWETNSCWMSSRAVPLCLRVTHRPLPHTHTHSLISPSPNPIKEVKREGAHPPLFIHSETHLYSQAHSEIQWHFSLHYWFFFLNECKH